MSQVAAVAVSRSTSVPQAETAEPYRIEHGDTLSEIALRHGTSVQALLELNPQIAHPDLIYAGDSLRLPQGIAPRTGTAEPAHPNPPGGTLSRLARDHDPDVATLTRRNGLGRPDWMDIARGEMGQKETLGSRHNPRIVEYHQSTTLRARSDETAWCSSFVNWTLEKAGYRGTDSAAAISWKNWGQPVGGLGRGREGDVVVLRNKATGQHHVGFLDHAGGGGVTLLGGNQSNQVKRSTFPLGSYDVVALRRPPA